MNEWYRNKYWDQDIESNFEKKILKTRSTEDKAQYLRVQASYLLENCDIKIQQKGINLINRIFEEFPESYEFRASHLLLGKYYLKHHILNKAEFHFQIIINDEKKKAVNHAITPLLLADTYSLSNQIEKIHKAYDMIIQYNHRFLFLDTEKFYYYKLLALTAAKLGKKEECFHAAKKAIEVSQNMNKEAQIFYNENIILLKKIIDKGICEI